MRASVLVACLCSISVLPAQDSGPSSKAAAALREALRAKPGDEKAITSAVECIHTNGKTPEAAVVKVLAQALQHQDPEVRLAGLAALRANTAHEALGALLDVAENETLLADQRAAREYYLALGQKGDARALPVLTKGLHVAKDDEVVSARILAIGHVKSAESVAALMRFLKSGSGGGNAHGKAKASRNPHMRDLATSLTVLTGERFGTDETAWIRWWTEHEDGYTLPAAPPELPRSTQRAWGSIWNDGPAK